MPTKLKNLKIKKVDFVDEGANPEADILIFKNKEGQPQQEEPKQESVLKRFISSIGKMVGLKQEEIEATMEEIEKGTASTFDEKMFETTRRKILDEIWDLCFALQSSLCSIITDEEAINNASELMKASLQDFSTVMEKSIEEWTAGKTANIMKEINIQEVEYAKSRLDEMIAKRKEANQDNGINNNQNIDENDTKKGEQEEMKIDKSKLTAAERAFLEEIEKKCGEEEEAENPVTKGMNTTSTEQTPLPNNPDDIYKGLHPAVAAELQMLRKRADDAEEKELTEIAKKYEIIGKKPEELVPILKNLKASGGEAYTQMLSILDTSVEMVNKSALFSEVGKSGHGGNEEGAWNKIEKKAEEILKSMPNLTRVQAIDKACEQNPELVHEYESEEN